VLQNLFYIVDGQTGERKGTASICKDISEQRRAGEALRKAQADLAEAAQRMTMGEFAASIAHELNQPLMAIVTSAETSLLRLEKDPPEIDAARRAAERVVRNGHRASEVIRSIRALLQKASTETEEFDANRAVRDVLELTGPRLHREGVSWELEVGAGELLLVGNRVQLQQVIINLVLNAVEAMTGVAGRAKSIMIRVRQDESRDVAITVEDTGSGVDPTKLDRIFDAFFSTKADGMGMGLAICRTIVEMHGGRLSASPRQPYGSIFRLSLPSSGR
jgi:C4-dicarboxylate-specific signal transduction histidine kinase